jgi:hypothetical protein
MRAIYIICEGQSEEEFVNTILRPHFNNYGIYDVRPILMSTSKGHKGGDVKFDRLKFNIEKLLNREHDVIVTTFIDYFRLKTDFPEFEVAQQKNNKYERVNILEQAIAAKINHPRFTPYIQLHEFEGLLFSSDVGFECLTDIPTKNLNVLKAAVLEKNNPEELNDGELTAPSKRLEQLIPGFDKNKPFYGGIIAEFNTIRPVLERCTRFNNWVQTLIEKVQA